MGDSAEDSGKAPTGHRAGLPWPHPHVTGGLQEAWLVFPQPRHLPPWAWRGGQPICIQNTLADGESVHPHTTLSNKIPGEMAQEGSPVDITHCWVSLCSASQ